MTRPSGLLLVDKPAGPTSHDVVARLRRALSERRVGHAGTLDPPATGLLVVAVGPATRLLRFALAGQKRYEGHLALGSATSTLDATGDVVARAPVPELATADLAAAAASLTGPISQVPPMVSAVRVGGRRLHEIAREGLEVERPARPVVVERFDVSATGEAGVYRFEIVCSPGTYVRVLVADLAERLGTLGHVRDLRRTASGSLRVADAVTLEAAEAAGRAGLGDPVGLVGSLARVVLTGTQVDDARHGRLVEVGEAPSGELAALDEAGHLLAVLGDGGSRRRPVVVMVEDAGEAR